MDHRDYPAGGLTERGRAWLAAGSPEGVVPRLAATVQLLRDGAEGPEVFCIERAASMVFAPSMLVFPGGGVDPRDSEPLALDASPWSRAFDIDDATARAVVAAAVREVFEETGVLLADAAPGPAARAALDAGETSLAHVLDGAPVRTDLLAPVARWVTPAFEARRYDTFFFRAAVPEGQDPDGATREAAAARWVRPADALAGHAAGTVRLLPPTIAALETLARYATVDEAMTGAPTHVPVVAPELLETADGLVLRVPS